MYGLEINQLIKDAVKQHCDDSRLAGVITAMLNETLAQQQHPRHDWKEHFRKRYKESILYHFKEELGDV